MMNREQPVIIGAARTAIGTFGGALQTIAAPELGACAIRAALERAGVQPSDVDEVLLGNVFSAGLGQGPARQAAIAAGLPTTAPATTINMICGSGLRAVNMAAEAIMLGRRRCVVAGGMESMSGAPFSSSGLRWGSKLGHAPMLDIILSDGLTDAFSTEHMGALMDRLAQQRGITRQQQDEFAAMSQQRCEAAQAAGRFNDEIAPFTIPQRKGDPVIFDTDEHPRSGVTAESLAKLRPAFLDDGTITPGNASGINDGAAAVVVVPEDRLADADPGPAARIVAWAETARDPEEFGIAPAAAIARALEDAGMALSDIELIEANEAFAAQAIALTQEVGWDLDIVNVNGGAIALGHPIGASGARILTTLLYEMQRRDLTVGMATLCIGGGMGVCTIVERV